MQFFRIGLLFCFLIVFLGVLAKAQSPAPAPAPEAMRNYELKLAEYAKARQDFEQQSSKYWAQVAEKRRLRNGKRSRHEEVVLSDYVLDQPPIYSGPPKPVDPSAPVQPPSPPAPPKVIPVVADFIKAAAENFNFVPEQPKTEIQFKKAYTKTAAAAGLTREQVVRIYAFESGGNGRYDVQAGLEIPRPDAKAVSTALGYNQLLNTNSVELMAEEGDQFIKALQAKSSVLSGKRKTALERKIDIVRAMVAVSREVPDTWTDHEKLGAQSRGLGIHAMNLDVDVGPLLQTQKLLDSILFAQRKGHTVPLTAAELEMMNFTGDGNGYDVLTMPAVVREQVPTSNLFQKIGYERNSIAVRNNTVAKLVAAIDKKMDEEAKLPGAKAMAFVFRR